MFWPAAFVTLSACTIELRIVEGLDVVWSIGWPKVVFDLGSGTWPVILALFVLKPWKSQQFSS